MVSLRASRRPIAPPIPVPLMTGGGAGNKGGDESLLSLALNPRARVPHTGHERYCNSHLRHVELRNRPPCADGDSPRPNTAAAFRGAGYSRAQSEATSSAVAITSARGPLTAGKRSPKGVNPIAPFRARSSDGR